MSPNRKEFEELFVNNKSFIEIETYLSKFNPIRVMKMENMEIRHSAILAWLLNPQESHCLQDKFLKAFLSEALKNQIAPESRHSLSSPTALDIISSDLGNSQIRLEWNNIDILIECPKESCQCSKKSCEHSNESWVFVIENKFNSTQGVGQLKGYLDRAQKTFANSSVQGIFLTLWDEKPDDNTYVSILYSEICVLLDSILKHNKENLSDEVLIFIRHYLDVLKDANDMNDETKEIEEIAKKLYREHKKVLDFIIEHGASTDFAMAVRQLFGEDTKNSEIAEIDSNEYHYGRLNNTNVSFLPKSWQDGFDYDGVEWVGCEKWWEGYPLILWFQLNTFEDGISGKLFLIGEIGPLSNHSLRAKLLEKILNVAKEIDNKKLNLGKNAFNSSSKYTRFLKNNSINIDDVSDSEKIVKAMKDLLLTFEVEIEAIGNELIGFKDEVE